METNLARIAKVAKEKAKEVFTNLAHLLDKEILEKSHREQEPKKVPGVDGVGKKDYEKNLQGNLEDLMGRLKRMAYRPQPVKRVYIPKPGTDKKRPLGIVAYEDKLVQHALNKVLSAVYEVDFLDCSCGFRPKRGCHDALQLLEKILATKPINYVVDTDIRGFFDHIDHKWLMKFLGHRIRDPRIHRLIRRMLKAGCIEQGEWHETEEGTPQGGSISPLFGNVYLHYVLDMWFEKIIRPRCKGEAYMVRYADDTIFCFQYENEARWFYEAMIERMGKFNLEIAQEKTKIIPFGRVAYANAKRQGQKPETFDFVGFTHYCGESLKGKFRVKRKTSRKKMKAVLARMKEWIKENRTTPIWEMIEELKTKMRGHYQFYGVTDNSISLERYAYKIRLLLFKWLNRRSQRKSFDWIKFQKFLAKCALPTPVIKVNIFERRAHIGYI